VSIYSLVAENTCSPHGSETQARDGAPALLCDPKGHVVIDSSGMLMDASGKAVTGIGDSLVVHMDRESLNDYPMGH